MRNSYHRPVTIPACHPFRPQPSRALITLPGSAPAVALRFPGEAVLLERLSALRCECGSDYQSPAKGWERAGMSYDGRRLELVQLNCTSCAQGRDVYYELASVSQAVQQIGVVDESSYAG